MRYLAFLAGLLLSGSCKKPFQFSPHEVHLPAGFTQVNARAIERIGQLPAGRPLRFVLVGDSQRFYEETDAFVLALNQRNDIDFVLLAGDISDFGMRAEFEWVHERLTRLKVPYVAVVGNHDMLGNGREIYRRLYGPEEFTFTARGYHFSCLNTNSKEVGFNGSIPNLNWLQASVGNLTNYRGAFVVSHMAPFHGEFDPALVPRYTSLLRNSRSVMASLHGHQHSYSSGTPYNDGIPYIVVGSFNLRAYVLLTADNEELTWEKVRY